MATAADTPITILMVRKLDALRGLLVVGSVLFVATCGDGAAGPGPGDPGELSGRVLFVHDSAGLYGIGAMNPDGSQRSDILPRTAGRIGSVLVGPNADRLVFMRDSVPFQYRIADDALQPLSVVENATPQAWTSGDRLAWSLPGNGVGGGERSFELFTTSSDGSDPVVIAPAGLNRTTHVRHVRRPFGDRLFFVGRTSELGLEIHRVGVDGSDLRPVTDDEFVKIGPEPSRDGSRVAYIVQRQGLDLTLDMVDVGGGEAVQLIRPEDYEEEGGGRVVSVEWSPDGTRLAVHVDLESTGVWLVYPDGREARYLLRAGFLDVDFAWSPEGDQLLMTSDAQRDVGRLDLETGEFANLTNTPGVGERLVEWIP